VAPPEVSVFPAPSFAVSVAVTLDPDATVGAETASVDVAAEMSPGVTVIVGIAVVGATPLTVTTIGRAEPAMVPVKELV
jgi:hypothetical protein